MLNNFYEFQHLELKSDPKTQYTVKRIVDDTVIVYEWIDDMEYTIKEFKTDEFGKLVKEGWW